MKRVHQYYTYILASQRNGTLYIGITNDLYRRVYEHKSGLKKSFTKRYGVNKLVYFEVFQYVNQGIRREKQLKKWNRSWKIELIEKENKTWIDLARDWYGDLRID